MDLSKGHLHEYLSDMAALEQANLLWEKLHPILKQEVQRRNAKYKRLIQVPGADIQPPALPTAKKYTFVTFVQESIFWFLAPVVVAFLLGLLFRNALGWAKIGAYIGITLDIIGLWIGLTDDEAKAWKLYKKEYAAYKAALGPEARAAQAALNSYKRLDDFVSVLEDMHEDYHLLEQCYDLDFIVRGCRNLPAVSALYDYLDSDRCMGLEDAYISFKIDKHTGRAVADLHTLKRCGKSAAVNQPTLLRIVEENEKLIAEVKKELSDSDNTFYSLQEAMDRMEQADVNGRKWLNPYAS